MTIKITAKSNKWIYVLSMLLLSTLVIPSSGAKTAVFAFVLYAAWFTQCAKPAILLMISSVLMNFPVSGTVWILATLPAYFGRSLIRCQLKKTELIYAAVTVGALVASFVLGEQANGNTMLLLLMCFGAYFTLANDPCDEDEIKAYALCGLIIVLVALSTSITADYDGLKYGRLSINDNVRSLANAVAISLMMLMSGILSAVRRKGNGNLLFYAAAVIGVVILFATLSKGAIIAFCAGIATVFLMSKIPLYKKIIFGILFVVVVLLVVDKLSQNEALNTDRLMENTSDLNGRTDIWMTYWRQMNRSAGRLLFGFGPGDLLRMRIMDYYAHSLFMDILFSYGVVGFVLVIGGFIVTWRKVLLSKQPLAISLMVFAILLYATHGIANNSSYYIIMGIATGVAQRKGSQAMDGNQKGCGIKEVK